MTMWTALLIVLAVFAFGDLISQLTRARLSSLFVIMMTFLVLFIFKIIPPDIIKRAGLTTLGPISMVMLLLNMGTTIDLAMLKREWRSVAASCIAMAIAIVSCLVLIPFIGRANALAAAPVINGGIIATTTMVKAASDQGLAMTAALAAFLYATQKFVGTLPASYFGLKAARRYVEEFRQLKAEDPDSILDQEELPQDSPRLSWAERNTRRFTIYISLFNFKRLWRTVCVSKNSYITYRQNLSFSNYRSGFKSLYLALASSILCYILKFHTITTFQVFHLRVFCTAVRLYYPLPVKAQQPFP